MKNKSNNKGLTLLEVIIGVGIITVVCVASISGLLRLFKSMNDSSEAIQTNSDTQAIIEIVNNQWRKFAYREGESGQVVIDNQQIWARNVQSRDLYDRNCIVTDILNDEQYDLLVAYQNTLRLEAMDRNLRSRGALGIVFQDTQEDCLNLSYDHDLARSIVVKRFSVLVNPSEPASFNNLSFDISKPDTTCFSEDNSVCQLP